VTWSLLDPGWDSINVKWSSQGGYEQASDEVVVMLLPPLSRDPGAGSQLYCEQHNTSRLYREHFI